MENFGGVRRTCQIPSSNDQYVVMQTSSIVVDQNIARRINPVSKIVGVTAVIRGLVGAAVASGDWQLGLGGGYCRAQGRLGQ
jgi:hypothetical protein